MEAKVLYFLLIAQYAPIYTLNQGPAITHLFSLKSSMDPLTITQICVIIQT